jgi:signal transduction histidine kinase
MLGGIGFVVLIIAIGVLITVDMVRTPAEVPHGQADGYPREGGRAVTAAVGGTRIRAPARMEIPASSVAGLPSRREGAGPSPDPDHASWPPPSLADLPGEAGRAFGQTRHEATRRAANETALRDKLGAMLVNMSRRSQPLVERQLRLIQHLEQSEHDEQRLADLSRLDRIALRMYRNAQNLLVLAGHESSTGWSHPVTLTHLVEAARSEIEEGERVSFDVQPDIAVRGSAVNDLVHLLVELTENATSFSSAGMPVHITGHMLHTGGALIDITDRGIGMAGEELAYANHELENPQEMDADVPKWMGLLVVARLAARHGIRVRLNQAEFGGLTALVWLPDELLTRHVAAAERGRAVPEQRGTLTRSHRQGSPQLDTQRAADPLGEPGWRARDAQYAAQGEPPAAVRLSGSSEPDAPGQDHEVIVPQAQNLATSRRLPIFDEIESRWSRGADHGAHNDS